MKIQTWMLQIALLFALLPYGMAQTNLGESLMVVPFKSEMGESGLLTGILTQEMEEVLKERGCHARSRSLVPQLETEVATMGDLSENTLEALLGNGVKTLLFGQVSQDAVGNLTLRLSFLHLDAAAVLLNKSIRLTKADAQLSTNRKQQIRQALPSLMVAYTPRPAVVAEDAVTEEASVTEETEEAATGDEPEVTTEEGEESQNGQEIFDKGLKVAEKLIDLFNNKKKNNANSGNIQKGSSTLPVNKLGSSTINVKKLDSNTLPGNKLGSTTLTKKKPANKTITRKKPANKTITRSKPGKSSTVPASVKKYSIVIELPKKADKITVDGRAVSIKSSTSGVKRAEIKLVAGKYVVKVYAKGKLLCSDSLNADKAKTHKITCNTAPKPPKK